MLGGFLDKTLSKFFRFLILPVLLSAGFFGWGEFVQAETINITENLEISENTTWQGTDKIIVNAPEGIKINSSAILTIEAGAIVKIGSNNMILIQEGTLNIEGAEDNFVNITSLKDDTIGGDDNNDSDATTPVPGDWIGIFANNAISNLNIDYANINYGGSGNLINFLSTITIINGNEVSINHSSILNSNIAITIGSASTTIANSNIYNPDFCVPFEPYHSDICGSVGLINGGAGTINAINNYWGHVNGPTIAIDFSDLTEVTVGSAIQSVFGDTNYEPFLSSAWAVPEPDPDPTGPEPIIFVPGVTACINLKVLTDLQESSYDWEIFGHYYQGLIQTIETAGFTQGEDFFVGCYDWRKTNGYNPDETVNSGEEYLMYWIDQALENSSSTKVDIVAHSMGGLLSRSYIQGDRYRDDVNQFIMLGTPNYGSSDSYFTWEGGDVPTTWPLADKIRLKSYLTYLKFKGLNITNVNTVHEKIPSIKQLLPTYNYITIKETELTILNSLMEEQNNWLKELNEEENLNKLTERTTSVKIINGDQVVTRNTITVVDRTLLDVILNKWVDGRPDEDIIDNRNNGDGTVLSSSVLIEGIPSSTINSAEHSALPDQVTLLVLQELGLESEQVFSSPEINDMLIIMVASPVDPVVTTADNKQVGGSINEVENAQYFSAGDSGVKIITIPNPTSGNFTVSLSGNGSGSYNMASIYSNSGSIVSSEISGEVTNGQSIIYNSSLQTGENLNIGELVLPTENIEPESNPPGGSVPLWFLQQMNNQQKVLGIKIFNKKKKRENSRNVFKGNLIYSPTVEKALLNSFINFLRY